MDEARHIAERLRSAEMELQLAQRAFDGTDEARQRYAHAIADMEMAQRQAMKFFRAGSARVEHRG